MLTGNKGEWSEIYVLLSVLGEGVLRAADENFLPSSDLYFPVNKVIRRDSGNRIIEFVIIPDECVVEVQENGCARTVVAQETFRVEANYLRDQLRASQPKAAFPLERVEYFMTSLGCERVKAASADKTDIAFELHDPRTGHDSICGFSIKSEFGNPSTLLNATAATNFTYKVNGLTDDLVNEINSIEGSRKIIGRMDRIFTESRGVCFYGLPNKTFERNLLFVDTRMDAILAEALLIHFRDHVGKVSDVVEILEEDNPLNFAVSGLYRHKIKKFLCAVALGFQPAKPWDGRDEANGGYIIATKNAEVVAYHVHNRDDFEEYLLSSTRFERASTTRHGYASLFRDGRSTLLNLNMQIRF